MIKPLSSSFFYTQQLHAPFTINLVSACAFVAGFLCEKNNEGTLSHLSDSIVIGCLA